MGRTRLSAMLRAGLVCDRVETHAPERTGANAAAGVARIARSRAMVRIVREVVVTSRMIHFINFDPRARKPAALCMPRSWV